MAIRGHGEELEILVFHRRLGADPLAAALVEVGLARRGRLPGVAARGREVASRLVDVGDTFVTLPARPTSLHENSDGSCRLFNSFAVF